jgi:hypothetical protein
VTLPQKFQRARSKCIRPFKAADAADEAVEEALAVEQGRPLWVAGEGALYQFVEIGAADKERADLGCIEPDGMAEPCPRQGGPY